MLRVLLYVVLIFLLGLGFAWLADRPGNLVLHWQGYEIRTSLMVAALALLIVIAAIAFVGWVIKALITAPKAFESFLGNRRRDHGYRALSTGIIAVGAGDVKSARRAAIDARNHLGDAPLTLLLSAQAAQLAGDGESARKGFEALAARNDTRILGLHGLFIEARRQSEHDAAKHFAEEANAAAPAVAWAGKALFEYQCRAGDWLGALRTLSGNAGARLLDRAAAEQLRAVLLTARADSIEASDPVEARAAALEAHRLDPALAPAAVVAARLLTRGGEVRRAGKVVEQSWKVAPHPDLAEAYASVRPGDSVRDRLKRVRRLADLRANHPEGAMAVARAAIDSHDWQAARNAIEGLAAGNPSERVCLLMAEIEEREFGDEGRVRNWLTRALRAPRDPAWIADGRIYPRWSAVSPVSGRVGVFEWKAPPEADPLRRSTGIETSSSGIPAGLPLPKPGPEAIGEPVVAEIEASSITDIEPAPPVVPDHEAGGDSRGEAAAALPSPPTVLPPVRPPDDPGPTSPEEDGEQRRFRLF